MTASVKWRVMTPVQRGGPAALTLKRGASHLAPVKCLSRRRRRRRRGRRRSRRRRRKRKGKKIFSYSITSSWTNDSPPPPLPHLPSPPPPPPPRPPAFPLYCGGSCPCHIPFLAPLFTFGAGPIIRLRSGSIMHRIMENGLCDLRAHISKNSTPSQTRARPPGLEAGSRLRGVRSEETVIPYTD